MSVEGRISVDVVFHDTDGTNAINVVTLQHSSGYESGKVAVVTGTAGTAGITFQSYGLTPYRDATGSLVTLNAITRVVFTWSGSSPRGLSDAGDFQFSNLLSVNNVPAMTYYPAFILQPEISGGVGTGTYTIVMYSEL
jgi:hypothetical protein